MGSPVRNMPNMPPPPAWVHQGFTLLYILKYSRASSLCIPFSWKLWFLILIISKCFIFVQRSIFYLLFHQNLQYHLNIIECNSFMNQNSLCSTFLWLLNTNTHVFFELSCFLMLTGLLYKCAHRHTHSWNIKSRGRIIRRRRRSCDHIIWRMRWMVDVSIVMKPSFLW